MLTFNTVQVSKSGCITIKERVEVFNIKPDLFPTTSARCGFVRLSELPRAHSSQVRFNPV